MNRHAYSLFVAAMFALASTAARADGDAAEGEKLAYTCLGCHGIENYKNAYPKYSVPKLGGQHTTYIQAALTEYKEGARWHPTMRGLATTLTEEDRENLAAYFKSATPAPASAEPVGTPPEKASLCVACHGRTGVGTMDEYPNLAGQHADYLAQAMNDYRLGRRKNPVMQPFAQQLSRDEIRALSEYFSAQKGLGTPGQD